MTFLELLSRYGKIEIPRIQRNYAQGRENESIVRNSFLNDLVTVSIGKVPPAAASCKTSRIKAINLPTSLKFRIKNSIRATKVLAINTIEK